MRPTDTRRRLKKVQLAVFAPTNELAVRGATNSPNVFMTFLLNPTSSFDSSESSGNVAVLKMSPNCETSIGGRP